jgi:hypothetical protein
VQKQLIALGCATAFLTNASQNLAKVRAINWLAHLLKVGGCPGQVTDGTSFGAEFVRIEVGEGE